MAKGKSGVIAWWNANEPFCDGDFLGLVWTSGYSSSGGSFLLNGTGGWYISTPIGTDGYTEMWWELDATAGNNLSATLVYP